MTEAQAEFKSYYPSRWVSCQWIGPKNGWIRVSWEVESHLPLVPWRLVEVRSFPESRTTVYARKPGPLEVLWLIRSLVLRSAHAVKCRFSPPSLPENWKDA